MTRLKELPFAVRTSTLLLELKLVLLAGVFVYAFFRFTWSLRLYSMGALLVAAAPEHEVYASGSADEVHNQYGHEWARLIHEGYRRDYPTERPFILMRAPSGCTPRPR